MEAMFILICLVFTVIIYNTICRAIREIEKTIEMIRRGHLEKFEEE